MTTKRDSKAEKMEIEMSYELIESDHFIFIFIFVFLLHIFNSVERSQIYVQTRWIFLELNQQIKRMCKIHFKQIFIIEWLNNAQ